MDGFIIEFSIYSLLESVITCSFIRTCRVVVSAYFHVKLPVMQQFTLISASYATKQESEFGLAYEVRVTVVLCDTFGGHWSPG